jgi:hypothetical protein
MQMSCRKDANAQSSYTLPPATSSSLGGVIVGNGLSVTPTGLLSISRSANQLSKVLYIKQTFNGGTSYTNEIWLVNYDGTQNTRVNISLPAGLFVGSATGASGLNRVFLSPDGTTIFFNVSDSNGLVQGIYSCNIDGTGVRQVVTTSGSNTSINLNGAF